MGTTTITAYVRVAREPQRARFALCWIAASVITVVALLAALNGTYVSLVTIAFAVILAREGWRAGQLQEDRVVQVSVRVRPDGVIVEMPGARLFSGRYVCQRYSCSALDLDGAGTDESGTFHLRARLLVSEAVDGGVVLDRREREFGEVTFRPVGAESTAALRSVFEG